MNPAQSLHDLQTIKLKHNKVNVAHITIHSAAEVKHKNI